MIRSTLACQSMTKMITHAERSSGQNCQLTCINNCQIPGWWYLVISVAEVKQAAAQLQGSSVFDNHFLKFWRWCRCVPYIMLIERQHERRAEGLAIGQIRLEAWAERDRRQALIRLE